MLTLTGSDTVTDYQAALASILYVSSAADPTFGGVDLSRTMSVSVADAAQSSASAATTVLVTPPAPVLVDTGAIAEQLREVSPGGVDKVLELIHTINQQGVTFFMVEQNASLALEIAHYGYVLQTGRVVLQGEASALLGDERIRDAYLGGDALAAASTAA